jgi:hypothetical protein
MVVILALERVFKMETITVFGLMMIAFFNSPEACQKWTDDTYTKEFGYVCFELDGF